MSFFISLSFRRTVSSQYIDAKAMPKLSLFLYVTGNEEFGDEVHFLSEGTYHACPR
jgi:hypothetical protein